MKKAILAVVVVVFCAAISVSWAGNLPNGTLTVPTGTPWVVTGSWLNPPGYDFATNPYSLDLSTLGPVTFSGTVDLSNVAMPGPGEWSSYYFIMKIIDQNGKTLQATFNTDWLGGWHGIPAQPWDRVRLEGENVFTNGPVLYFCTQGGVRDDGKPDIVPSDRIYSFAMTADPDLNTVALSVFANGREEPAKQWYDVGTVGISGFDWAHTQLWAKLAADGTAESTGAYYDMNIAPIPPAIPEPVFFQMGALLGMSGLGLLRLRRRA